LSVLAQALLIAEGLPADESVEPKGAEPSFIPPPGRHSGARCVETLIGRMGLCCLAPTAAGVQANRKRLSTLWSKWGLSHSNGADAEDEYLTSHFFEMLDLLWKIEAAQQKGANYAN
jgi:hypothetical protein